VYPNEQVTSFISKNVIPVKIHIKENHEGFQRFGVQWTPTVIVTDPSGTERYQFEGYLPVDEFLPQMEFGLGKIAFAKSNWKEAELWFQDVVEQYAGSDVAPEARYWMGVDKYKATGDVSALKETAKALQSRYPESVWAKKASVWAPAEGS
jgi:hypothetical protein